MRIYTNTFDISRPSPHRFWVSPFSDFKIGVKLVNGTEALENEFTVKAGSVELTPDETQIDGFTTYTIKSNGTGFVDYTIEVDGIAQKFNLVQIVTDSTVFEVGGEGGGDVPADVATKSWVNSQISDFITDDALVGYATESFVNSAISDFVEEGELTAYATQDELTGYATKAELTAYAETSDIKDSTITFTQGGVTKGSFTLNQATSATIALDAGGGGGGDSYTKAETDALLSAKADATKQLPADLTSWITDGWTYEDENEGQSTPFTKLTTGFYDISPYCDYTVSAQYVYGWSGYDYTTYLFSYCTNGKTVFCHQGQNSMLEGTDYEGNISGNISVYFEVDTTKIPDSMRLAEAEYGYSVVDKDSVKWIAYVSENMDGQAPYTLQELSTFSSEPDDDGIRYGEESFFHNATEDVTPGFVEVSAVYGNEISGFIDQQGLTSLSSELTSYIDNNVNPLIDAKVSHQEYDGTTGTAPIIYAMTTVYETDWADISASADENTFYVVLPDPA